MCIITAEATLIHMFISMRADCRPASSGQPREESSLKISLASSLTEIN
jgi:hypothetical protein